MSNSRPEVVTYRLNNKMVYVTPAKDYEEAVDFARKVYPDELMHIRREQISFSILVTAQKTVRTVRIGAMAWGAVVNNLKRYEIIDVHVKPEIYVERLDDDAPPDYPAHVRFESKEAAEFYGRTRAASAPENTKSRSAPNSTVGSRESSPSARSTHSTHSVRSVKKDDSNKTWFKLR